jgi:hypothetical protein
MTRRPWTDKDDRTLLQLKREGLTLAAVGEQLDRTALACAARARVIRRLRRIEAKRAARAAQTDTRWLATAGGLLEYCCDLTG